MKNFILFLIATLNCFCNLFAQDKYEVIVIGNNKDSIIPNFSIGRINNKGQCYGMVTNGTSLSTLVAWDPIEGVKRFNEFDGWYANACDINDRGYIVGVLSQKGVNPTTNIAFLWNPWTEELKFGPYDVSPRAINASNQVVGSISSNGYGYGSDTSFIWDSEKFAILSSSYRVLDINDKGEILHEMTGTMNAKEFNNEGIVIGTVSSKTSSMACVLVNGNRKLLPLPSYPVISTQAVSINNLGEIVGYYLKSKYTNPIGCLWIGEKFIDLNSIIITNNSKVEIISPIQINDRSQIIANGYYNGEWANFMLNPIKESSEN